LARVVVVGSLAYVAVVVVLRMSGNRSLAQTNAFDFIVTVALGATLGGVLTGRRISLAEATLAFAVLLGLQHVVTSLQVRSPRFRRAITQAPVLLVREAEPLMDAMEEHHIRLGELHTAIRKEGFGSFVGIQAVVLEVDGRLSVISDAQVGDGSALTEPRQRGR
jgi:uncharacterized membrane protein YcaP (DUF421 family)